MILLDMQSLIVSIAAERYTIFTKSSLVEMALVETLLWRWIHEGKARSRVAGPVVGQKLFVLKRMENYGCSMECKGGDVIGKKKYRGFN